MVGLIEEVRSDVRFALRGWRRAPGFAIAAISRLALVRGVLPRPLPFPESERLVQIYEGNPRGRLQDSAAGAAGPAAYALPAAALGAVAMTACLIPAMRAARVYPAAALRSG